MINRLVYIVVFVILVPVIVIASYNIGVAESYPKLKGVQVFVLDSIYASNYDLFFKEIRSKGVDTVFFRVFHNEGDRAHLGLDLKCSTGVYFKTDQLCTVADLLDDIIVSAKQHDIKIYAWMASRSLSDLKQNDNISLAFSPNGNIINGYGANIFRDDISSKIVDIFKDLAKYPIDGILLQDDFIIKYNEGADNLSRELFLRDTGFRSDPSTFFRGTKEFNGKRAFTGYKEVFYIWSLWKHEYLMQLLSRIKQAIRSVNPDIMLAANVYYETPLEKEKAFAWYSQSLDGLLSSGADYLAVMGYIEQIAEEMNLDYPDAEKLIMDIAEQSVHKISQNARVIIKLQLKSFKNSGTILDSRYNINLSNMLDRDGISVTLVPVNSSNDINNNYFK